MFSPLPDELVRSRIHRRVPQFRFRMEIFDQWLTEALTSCTAWLDLGCGRNDLLGEFAGSRLQVGADRFRHPQLVRECGIYFVQSRAEQLPFCSGVFDVVTMRQVVEHLPCPRKVFAELHRVLTPGGRILIVTTNRRAPLVWLASHIPSFLKFKLLREIYGKTPEEVYPTYHRWNTWQRVCQPPPGFRTVRAVLTENPIKEHVWLFRLSLLWMRVSSGSTPQRYWSNLIVEYEKTPSGGS